MTFLACVWLENLTKQKYNFKMLLSLLLIYYETLYFQMVQLSNWLPDVFTQAAGMEVAKLSYLGPFFALSVFAEDNVSSSHLKFNDSTT
jgi:hypothetical protein